MDGTVPLAGFNFELLSCPSKPGGSKEGGMSFQGCQVLPVFGASGGVAEDAGLLVSAGHAFTERVFGFCLSERCASGSRAPRMEPLASPALLTSLSVSLLFLRPDSTVCLRNGAAFAATDTGRKPTPHILPPVCSEVLAVETRETGRWRHAGNTSSPTSGRLPAKRRGVAFVKTYKTGSSTMTSLLYRYADNFALDVAVNAKAVPAVKHLETRLEFKEKRVRPTDCLYEFHNFKPCGKAWLKSQATSGIAEPKPFGLVADHSRLMPLSELRADFRRQTGKAARRARRPTGTLPAACHGFIGAMRAASFKASHIASSGHRTCRGGLGG